MTFTAVPDARSIAPHRRPIGRSEVLVVGVILIPLLLAVALNSRGPLTEETAWRMAVATVAGQTIAILSAIVAVVLTVKRGYGVPAIIAMVVIAAAVTAMATNTIGNAGDDLISRLETVREVDLLNH